MGRWCTGDSWHHWTLPLQVFSSERLQDKKSWVQAQGACRELGAQLLSLASYEEEHFVANMLNKIFGYRACGDGPHACLWGFWFCWTWGRGWLKTALGRSVLGLGMTCVSATGARTILPPLK